MLALGVLVSISLSTVVQALEPVAGDTRITQFYYEVVDKNGNIKETGITPDADARYIWSGVVLENRDTVHFWKSSGDPFWILKNTQMNFVFNLNKSAIIEFFVYKGFGTSNYTLWDDGVTRDSGASYSRTAPESADYHWALRNASSEPVIVTRAEFTF